MPGEIESSLHTPAEDAASGELVGVIEDTQINKTKEKEDLGNQEKPPSVQRELLRLKAETTKQGSCILVQ